jgi:replicative DNA helicase
MQAQHREIEGQILPNNVQAEINVLGGILLSNRAITLVTPFLQPSAFYQYANRIIYSAMITLYEKKQPIDINSLCAALEEKSLLSEAGGRDRLIDLRESVFTIASIAEFGKIIVAHALRRQLVEASDSIKALGYDSHLEVQEAIAMSMQSLSKIGQACQLEQGTKHIEEVAQEVLAQMADASTTPDKQAMILPTGLADLDRLLQDGIENDTLCYLAARPSVGKTSVAVAIALHAAKNEGANVLFFSVEVNRGSLFRKMLSQETGLTYAELRRSADFDARTWGDIYAKTPELVGTKIFINDKAKDISEIVAEIRAHKARYPQLALVVIDYLQLMSHKAMGNANLNVSVGNMSKILANLKQDLGLRIICLSQLNRESETRGDKAPELHDMRDSGSLEQDADMVLMLQKIDERSLKVWVRKNRNGATGDIKLGWQPETAKPYDLVRGYGD